MLGTARLYPRAERLTMTTYYWQPSNPWHLLAARRLIWGFGWQHFVRR